MSKVRNLGEWRDLKNRLKSLQNTLCKCIRTRRYLTWNKYFIYNLILYLWSQLEELKVTHSSRRLRFFAFGGPSSKALVAEDSVTRVTFWISPAEQEDSMRLALWWLNSIIRLGGIGGGSAWKVCVSTGGMTGEAGKEALVRVGWSLSQGSFTLGVSSTVEAIISDEEETWVVVVLIQLSSVNGSELAEVMIGALVWTVEVP